MNLLGKKRKKNRRLFQGSISRQKKSGLKKTATWSMLAASILAAGLGVYSLVDDKQAPPKQSQGYVYLGEIPKMPNLENIVQDGLASKLPPVYPYGQTILADNVLMKALDSYKGDVVASISLISHFSREYGSFDNRFSNIEKLEKLSLALARKESYLSHIDPFTGNVVTSHSGAKGVFQFKEIGIKDLNQLLEMKKKRAKSTEDPALAKYLNIPYFDYSVVSEASDRGRRENVRAGVLYMKLLCELPFIKGHEGAVEATHNWGNRNRIKRLYDRYGGDMRKMKKHFPAETLDYVNMIWRFKEEFRKSGRDKVMLAENMVRDAAGRYMGDYFLRGVKRLKKKDFKGADRYFSAVIPFFETPYLAPKTEEETRIVSSKLSSALYYSGLSNFKMGNYKRGLQRLQGFNSDTFSHMPSFVKKGVPYLMAKMSGKR